MGAALTSGLGPRSFDIRAGEIVTVEIFRVGREELRQELAADLSRGGYVFHEGAEEDPAERYFEKHLVLSRPGLLTRAARLLAALVPADTERLAVVGVPAATLATALSQHTGIPLLLGRRRGDGEIEFDGEYYSDVKALLVEDVVFTGGQARQGAEALVAIGATVLGIVCLLDRENGAAQRLAEIGTLLRPLFVESELVRLSRGST
jgi:orotate phosphoribosyltransferase